MQTEKSFELLDGLPPYGPMYVPISEDGGLFSYEGCVVRFIKSDGSAWVANFQPGWTGYSHIFEIPGTNKVFVIAGGKGYLMSPDQETPLKIFGSDITEMVPAGNKRFVAAGNTDLVIINPDATISLTKRISWDGLKDLVVAENIVSGLAFDPMNQPDEWQPFSYDLNTNILTGGSYGEEISMKKPFWKFW